MLWGLLLGTTIFVLVSGWFVLWSGLVLVFVMMISPEFFFVLLAVLSIVVASRIAPRSEPRTVRQVWIAAACLFLLGTSPILARHVQMNVFWMANIPNYPGSERVARRTKLYEDINESPTIEETYRLPTSTGNALAFYASELGRRGWKKRADSGPACWIEQHAVHFCRYQYCDGPIRIAFDAASSRDEHVTAPGGPVDIKLIVKSWDLPCSPGQPN